MGNLVIGIGVYKREQWPLLRETAEDAHLLEESYDDWLDVIHDSLRRIETQGMESELIAVDVQEFLSYCSRKGIRNDASSRSRFVAERFREKKTGEDAVPS